MRRWAHGNGQSLSLRREGSSPPTGPCRGRRRNWGGGSPFRAGRLWHKHSYRTALSSELNAWHGFGDRLRGDEVHRPVSLSAADVAWYPAHKSCPRFYQPYDGANRIRRTPKVRNVKKW